MNLKLKMEITFELKMDHIFELESKAKFDQASVRTYVQT